MKVLLIGKHGQLGTELGNVFVKTKTKLYAFGHDELDICDYAATQTIIKKILPDIVINAAAHNVLTDCETNPRKAFEINAFALKNLAGMCHAQHIKLVTYSTDYVFDGVKGKPYAEIDQTNPLQMYGLSKLAGEIISLNYNPDSIVIRTCGVYGGTHGSRTKGNFVMMIVHEAQKRKILEISSEQIVSPTYAQDLAQCTIRLLQNKSARGIYHLVNEGHCSWYEFAKKIVAVKKITTKVLPVNRHGEFAGIKRPLMSALLNTRAKASGIVMPPWQDALRRYLTIVFPKSI